MAAGNPQAPDLERLIQRAAKGDQSALVETCQRYRVPVLAAALNAGVSWDEAVALVGPTLRLLCTQLLDEIIKPSEWREQLVMQTQTAARMGSVDPNRSACGERSGLSGIASIPRLAKRRAAREVLRQLPLPQLTCVLLKYIDGVGAADMVGVAANSQADVVGLLVAANERLVGAVRAAGPGDETNGGSETP